MASKIILNDLSSGKFENIYQKTADFLDPVLNHIESVDDGSYNQYGMFAAKFLHGAVEHISAGRQPASLLQAVLACCQCYQLTKSAITLTEPFTVLKLLYHIVIKIQYKEHVEILHQVGEHLYTELCSLAGKVEGTALSILNSAYCHLWNTCIKLEDDKNFTFYSYTLKYRHLALRILLQKEDSVSQVLDKYLIAVNRYDALVQQSQSKSIEKMEEEILSLPVRLSIIILDLLLPKIIDKETDESAVSVLNIFLFLIKFIQKNNCFNEVEVLEKCLHKFCEDASHSDRINKMCKLFQSIFKSLKVKTQKMKYYTELSIVFNSMKIYCKEFLESLAKNSLVLFINLFVNTLKQLDKTLDEFEEGVVKESSLMETLSDVAQVRTLLFQQLQNQKEKSFEVFLDALNIEITIIYKILKRISVVDTVTQTKFIDIAVEAEEIYIMILDSSGSTGLNNKTLEQKRYACGYLMSNFGTLCDDRKLNHAAIVFYEASYNQISKWTNCNPDIKQKRVEEVKLQRLLDCYVEVYVKLGNLESAMDVIVRSFTDDFIQLNTAVKSWTRVKKEALRKGDTTLSTRTLADSVRKETQSSKDFNPTQLLWEELNIFKNSRKRYFDIEHCLLLDLLDRKDFNSALDNARYELDMVHLLWISGIESDRPIHKYLEDTEVHISTCTSVRAQLLRGELYFWQYIIHQGDWCSQALKTTLKLQESNSIKESAKRGEEAEIQTTETVENIYTFGMETEYMKNLEKSLSLWSKIIDENNIDVGSLIKLLLLSASICRLAGKQSLELHSLQMALKLAEKKNNTQMLTILGRIVDILIVCGMYTEAQELLSHLQSFSDSKDKQEEENVLNILRQAELCLHTGQTQKAVDTLQDVFLFTSQKNRDRFVGTVEGKAKRLLSVIFGMPGDHVTDTGSIDYCLDLAYEAQRLHSGVYQFLVGKDTLKKNVDIKGHNFEMFDVIHQVLTTLFHNGQMYRLIGELRDAKCYLKEGWYISHHFGLPFWTGKFLLEITRITVMAENIEEASKAIVDCHRLLGSKVNAQSSDSEMKSENKVNIKRKTDIDTDCERFDNQDAQINVKKEQPFSRQRNIKMIPQVAYEVPPCFSHVIKDESCDFCCDKYSKLFAVQLSLVISQYCNAFSSNSESDGILDEILNHCSSLLSIGDKSRKSKKCDKIMNMLNNFQIPSSLAPSIDLKSIYFESLVQKGELLCLEGEKKQSSGILKLAVTYIEAEEMVDVFHTCFLLARLDLCNVLTMLPDNSMQRTELAKDEGIPLVEENMEVELTNTDVNKQITTLSDSISELTLESKTLLKDSEAECSKMKKKSGSRINNLKQEKRQSSEVDKKNIKKLESSSIVKKDVKFEKNEPDKNDEMGDVEETDMKKIKSAPNRRKRNLVDKEENSSSKSQLRKPSKIQSNMKKLESVRNGENEIINLPSEKNKDFENLKHVQKCQYDVLSTPKVKPNTFSKKDNSNFSTPKPAFALKTPRSVCSSRKQVLDLLLDSSDEEEAVKKSNIGIAGRGRRRNKTNDTVKKALYENIGETIAQENVEKNNVENQKRKMGKIPRLINGTTLKVRGQAQNQKSCELQSEISGNCTLPKKRGRGKVTKVPPEIECQRNADTETCSADIHFENEQMCVSPEDAPSKTGGRSKGSRRQTKKDNCNAEVENCIVGNETKSEKLDQQNTDVFDFNEIDSPNTVKNLKLKPKGKKGCVAIVNKGRKTRKLTIKNDFEKIEKERTRHDKSEEAAQDSIFQSLSDDVCESLDISCETIDSTSDDVLDAVQFNLEKNKIFDPDGCFSLEKSIDNSPMVVEPELELPFEDLNFDDSIEIMRGDVKKNKQTTGGRKKSAKSSTSSETTEVVRSSKPIKTKLTESNLPELSNRRPRTAEVTLRGSSADSPSDMTMTDVTTISTLERAFNQIKHFPPCQTYTTICQMLALQYLQTSPLKTAYYLTEAVAVTFRHQAMMNTGKKIRRSVRQTVTQNKPPDISENKSKQSVTIATDTDNSVDDDEDRLKKAMSSLKFNKTVDDLKVMTSIIPDNWAVCQVSMVNGNDTSSQMLLTRFENDKEPLTAKLPGYSSLKGKEILKEFRSIMEASSNSFKLKDKVEWWKVRMQLDDRMCSLLLSIEKYWLQHWRFLLKPKQCLNKSEQTKLKKDTTWLCKELEKLTGKKVTPDLVQVFLQSGECLTDQEVESVLHNLTEQITSLSDIGKLVPVVRQKMKDLSAQEGQSGKHIILILDKTIQQLPWENIPILRLTSVSRMPSLYHMYTQLSYLQVRESSVYHSGVDSRNVFYVINPEKDFASTQETFQSWFESEEGWEGIIAKEPTSKQISQALSERDLFIYCGHGSGGKYLPGFDLQQLSCRSVALLMGCSSGELQIKGQLDPAGMMLNYFLADCPCVIANLWDVTDKDIDRFLESLLRKWLPSAQGSQLLHIIPEAREACRLRYLTGAAPVVYGLPVFLKK